MDFKGVESHPIANSGYPDTGNFGAGQGCSDCWTQTFMFPSNDVLDLGLTLMDNQTGWGGQMDYVNIDGGNATDTIDVAGVTDTSAGCGIALQGSGQCSSPVGEGTTQISTSGSSGGRTASVMMQISVQDLFAYQAQQEQVALGEWGTLDSQLTQYFSGGQGSCESNFFNALQQQDAELQSEMVFMIADTMFGAVPIPGVSELAQFIVDEADSVIWHGAGSAAAQAYASADIGFNSLGSSFPGGLQFDCSNDVVVWNQDAPTALGSDLASSASSTGSLYSDIEADQTGAFRSELQTQYDRLGTVISSDAQLISQGESEYRILDQAVNDGSNDLSEFAQPLLASACRFAGYTIAMEQVAGMSAPPALQACAQVAQASLARKARANGNAVVSRGAFAAILTQVFHLATPASTVRVRGASPTGPYHQGIESAFRFMGSPHGAFRPDQPVTRLAAAYALGRLLIREHRMQLPSLRDAHGIWDRFKDTKNLAARYPMLARYAGVAVEAELVTASPNGLLGPRKPLDVTEARRMIGLLSRP